MLTCRNWLGKFFFFLQQPFLFEESRNSVLCVQHVTPSCGFRVTSFVPASELMSLHTLGGRGGHCWLCSSLQPCFACSGQSCWAWTPNRTLFLVLVYTQDARGNGGTVGAKLCGHKGDFSASLEGVKVRSWQRNSAVAFRCWAGRGAGSGVSFCSFNSQPRVWNVVILTKNRHLNSWDCCKAVVTLLWWVAGFYRVLFPWVTEIPVKFLWSLCYENVFI